MTARHSSSPITMATLTATLVASSAMIVACHPPTPPTPPHPAFPEAVAIDDDAPRLARADRAGEEGTPPSTADADISLGLAARELATPSSSRPLVDPLAPPTIEPEPASEPAKPAKPAAPAKADPWDALAGNYRYRSGGGAVGPAIESVVAEMNGLVRGVARKRLAAANEVPSTLAIAHDGDVARVTLDGRTYEAKLGGAAKSVTDPNGEASKMRLRMVGKSLYQTFDAGQGVRTNIYTPGKSGRVTMSVRITSKQLPKDVRYSLVFAR